MCLSWVKKLWVLWRGVLVLVHVMLWVCPQLIGGHGDFPQVPEDTRAQNVDETFWAPALGLNFSLFLGWAQLKGCRDSVLCAWCEKLWEGKCRTFHPLEDLSHGSEEGTRVDGGSWRGQPPGRDKAELCFWGQPCSCRGVRCHPRTFLCIKLQKEEQELPHSLTSPFTKLAFTFYPLLNDFY